MRESLNLKHEKFKKRLNSTFGKYLNLCLVISSVVFAKLSSSQVQISELSKWKVPTSP